VEPMSKKPSKSDRRSARNTTLIAAIAIQLIAIGVVLVAPFGFDHPSSRGLQFGLLMLAFAIYSMAVFVGVIWSANERRWVALVAQLVPGLFVYLRMYF
jgi:hypothetical protein